MGDDLSAFDSIDNLDEAKRCLKVTYCKYENCHSGARFFMWTTISLLLALLWSLYA
jgi:hypothetical protein